MNQSLTKIQTEYRKYRLMVLLMLLMLIAALVMALVDRRMILPILGIAVLYHLFLLRPCQKAYTRMITTANLEHTVCKKLDAKEVLEKGGTSLNLDVMNAANLMPCQDGSNVPLICWEMKGVCSGIPVTLADVTIPQKFALTDKRARRRVHFNAGVWAHLELPNDTGLHVKLLDEVSVPTPIRMAYFKQKISFHTASIGDEEIGKRFVLYCPRDYSPFLSTSLLRRLKEFMNYTPGYIAVSVNGNKMDVFVRGRFLAAPVSVSKKITADMLEFDPFPELSYIISLAKAADHS